MKFELRRVATLALLSGIAFAGPVNTLAHGNKDVREFYIKTVHVDGKATTKGDHSHGAEPFPDTEMPEGRGLQLHKPDDSGKWRMRAFAFMPSQIVVNQGDTVKLHFVGVQGMRHGIHVEGGNIVDERFVVTRGKIHTVSFKATEPGAIEIECYDHLPSMRGEVVILPRSVSRY